MSKPTQTTIFTLDAYISALMQKMDFHKSSPEAQQEMYNLMERQILYRLMTALSMSLDTEAAATFAIEAQKPGADIAGVVSKIIETNDATYKAVMDELAAFEKETLETFQNFSPLRRGSVPSETRDEGVKNKNK